MEESQNDGHGREDRSERGWKTRESFIIEIMDSSNKDMSQMDQEDTKESLGDRPRSSPQSVTTIIWGEEEQEKEPEFPNRCPVPVVIDDGGLRNLWSRSL